LGTPAPEAGFVVVVAGGFVVDVVLVLELVVVEPGSTVEGGAVVVVPPGVVVVVVVGRTVTGEPSLPDPTAGPGALDADAAVIPTTPTKNTAIPVTIATRLVEREDNFNLLGFDG
jgi:hypothetical protein